MKIPQKYNKLIFEGYEELLNKGMPKSQIADILNERWGTDFPESSMRGRYERERIAGTGGMEEAEYQERLFTIARNDLRLKEQRKILVKQRGMVDAIASEYSQKKLVENVIVDVWGKDAMTHNEDAVVQVTPLSSEVNLYAYGDVHWGYEIDHPQFKYNNEIAKERMHTIYSSIVNDTKANGYKEIYIADLGDQIEGSALRVSQLIRITESMTQQAKNYANEVIKLIKMVAKELPDVKVNVLMISEDNHAQLRLFNTKRNELPENLALLITNQVEMIIDTLHEADVYKNLTFIQGDEIVLNLGEKTPYNVVFAHGHQYGRSENILEKTEQRHGHTTHLYVAGHWHQFSVKYKNVKDHGQQAMIFLPSVVGDTDFSETLFLSCYPGFLKISVDLTTRVSNAKLIRL